MKKITAGKRRLIQMVYTEFRGKGTFTLPDVMQFLGVSRRYARDVMTIIVAINGARYVTPNDYMIQDEHRTAYQELGIELEFNRHDLTAFVSSLIRTFPEKELLPTLLEFTRQATVSESHNIPRFSTGKP